MSLTQSTNRLAIAARAFDAAMNNPPIDEPFAVEESKELTRAVREVIAALPWEVLDAVLPSAAEWAPDDVVGLGEGHPPLPMGPCTECGGTGKAERDPSGGYAMECPACGGRPFVADAVVVTEDDEDASDLAALWDARAEPGSVTWERIKVDLGLADGEGSDTD
jgi:hypothetical protein